MVRRTPFLFVFVLALLFAVPAYSQNAPRSVTMSGKVDRPLSEVFGTLKRYFSDASLSTFQLTGAYEGRREATLTASMHGIDSQSWGEWAYCKVSPLNLLDNLDDGSAKLKVKLEASNRHSTIVRVTADMVGTYSLGSTTHKVQCTSRNVLETRILSVAGVPAATPN